MQCMDTMLELHAINRKSEKVEMGEMETCMQELYDRGRPLLNWMVGIQSEVEKDEILNTREMDAHRRQAIYRVPNFFIRDGKRIQAYTPEMVSMGPYHHGEEQLLPMEEHKRRALRRFLVRNKRGVSEYREALSGVVQELMNSYKDLEKEWMDDEERFLQLMIFDGCFMIELFRMEALRAHGSLTRKGYDDNDPIFSGHGMLSNMPRIKRDMLMIENQIPLLVLKKLLSVAQRGVVDDQDEHTWRSLNQTLNNMVLAFFGVETEYYAQDKVELGSHALDVVRKSMIKDINCGKRIHTDATSIDVIWPATRLAEAGIRFRKSGGPSLEDIDFSPGCLHPTLSLPQLVVDDATESKFLNIMAFEHLHVSSGNEVSSYVCFMGNIIDSAKDVSLLSQNDIIKNFVGTDQAVADLFNGISHDVSIDPASSLVTVHENVTRYCRTSKAKAAYSCSILFFNAWVWISSLGATLLFFVTCLQLLYAMLDFYRTSSI